MEHKAAIAIWDSDSWFSSYWDWTIEAWANNGRVFNFNSTVLEIQKKLFWPWYKWTHLIHDIRWNNYWPDWYNRESIHYWFVQRSVIWLPNNWEDWALVKTYNKWDTGSQHHKLYQIAYNWNAIYLRTNTNNTTWWWWTLVWWWNTSVQSADFVSIIDPSDWTHTINHNLGKQPSVIKVETIRCNGGWQPSSASYWVVWTWTWKNDWNNTQHTHTSYDWKSYVASKDWFVFRNSYWNTSSIKIQNVNAWSFDIVCDWTFNSGDNYHKLNITLF